MKKLLIAMLVFVCATALFANGQTEATATSENIAAFPAGPITLVCPWNPGAGADLICRMFEKLGPDYFGVPVVVENQNGAAGVTATLNFLNAKADGYSVLFDNGGVFTSKSLTGAASYSIDDYQPLCGIVKDMNVLIANKKTTGISNMDEFLKAYSNTGKALVVGCATGGIPHMCIAQLFKQANVTYKQAAYNGATEITAALLGGHIDIACIGASEISIVKDSSDVTVLAVFGEDVPQIAGLENAKSVFDYGYKIDTCVWRMLLVPKGTPQDVYDVLYKGFTGMIQDPRFAEFAATNSLIIDMKSPEEVTSSVKAELEDMRVVFQDLKLGIYADK